jgi:hypothetical protein
MTLSLLLIEAESRVVKWASAGHDPAIVFELIRTPSAS